MNKGFMDRLKEVHKSFSTIIKSLHANIFLASDFAMV